MKTTLSTAVLALAVASPALAETWTMTSTWPSSLELIEIDRKWVENVGKMVDPEVLTIEFYDGGSLVPAGEVFGAVESGTIQAGADWPGYWAGRNPAFSPLATTASLFNAVDYVNWIQEWGGADLYNEIYGQFGMVYLPYGVTNNESGFRTVSQPIRTVDDLQGLRLRLSGLEQGRLLEKLGGSQVSMAGGEIYQSLERGVIDGAEFSTPNVDFSGGFQQVTSYWSTPGWHQSSSVFGVMINKNSWDALDEATQERLRLAADATMLWSLSFTERRANEAYRQFEEAGTEINRLDDAALERIQELANETIVEVACENRDSARVYASMIGYLEDYATWRTASAPFDLGRTPNGPDLAEIEACAQ
ncbi:TRAP transporter substrate-binding protein DctP [Paracoccus tibetensis]|uniref:TRAP-type mannitol/chloroaromatic compound transport system, substrate-binding protein n=1 Tax=Paracoccus tibetensis TaxID=336292 RepID=A0A1G5GDR1_9RHOB|nr:TRAP transporter substrate-binding protein DctP [Paracoccus tibetensis]SCY49654.1 TRAP-type mannitol/chloroaromatic compound transport system, substrate-binding protein [Paracoccus tibetensis]